MSLRVVFLMDDWTVNAWYRQVGPLEGLLARGHEVKQISLAEPGSWEDLLRWSDLLHIHRSCVEATISLARRAKRLGVPIVWDDDEDLTNAPKGSAVYRDVGGLRGRQRLRDRARLFELVDLVTTPSTTLGEIFLGGGARDVCVIENYVIDELVGERLSRRGTWIGWVATDEHRFDLEHLPVTEALARLLDAHADVHVMTIGVRLPLSHPRYEHNPGIPPRQLLRQVSSFDVGIAPLSTQLALNRSRSNVKVKEYAVVGVPWLASPIGPYAELGEDEGGQLVEDDGWLEALDALVSDPRRREQLARQAEQWGREQLLCDNAVDWEDEFADLIDRVGQRRAS